MAYPIKMRFRNKETNEIVKDKNKMISLNTKGQPFSVSNDGFYTYVNNLSSKDYFLEIATERDKNDKWIYVQIGY